MPKLLTVSIISALKLELRSKIRKPGAESYGNASRNCWMTHALIGHFGYIAVEDSSTVLRDDEKAVQNAKC
jgi:hypothetical protein